MFIEFTKFNKITNQLCYQ